MIKRASTPMCLTTWLQTVKPAVGEEENSGRGGGEGGGSDDLVCLSSFFCVLLSWPLCGCAQDEIPRVNTDLSVWDSSATMASVTSRAQSSMSLSLTLWRAARCARRSWLPMSSSQTLTTASRRHSAPSCVFCVRACKNAATEFGV